MLLFERVTKSECTSPSLLHDLPARKIFKVSNNPTIKSYVNVSFIYSTGPSTS